MYDYFLWINEKILSKPDTILVSNASLARASNNVKGRRKAVSSLSRKKKPGAKVKY